ncbi:hypothetical protein [Arsenicicoccus dermatophilus]|uniref:hypothetical protein n=1 Tax=Arsenicicoccus dermatophilus TaxID=1076331 RepID=UPI001F4C6CEB|nr:hypothetical protein [Arsenicicoccus dermatophilus]MCH8613974.1 hypothetical protein [Arsenicicoccus dermatophilus]
MKALRTRWTELHTSSVLLSLSAATAGGAALTGAGGARLVVLALIPVTACAGTLVDGFLGLGVGVLGATASAVAVRETGGWRPTAFPTLLTLVLSLVLVGWVAGLLGGSARRLQATLRRGRPADVRPALSSLGLVDADLAALRADEEITRARRHRRPLAAIAIRLDPRADISPDQAQAALRCLSRHLEHRLRRSDAPFALDEATVAALLPETDALGLAALEASLPASVRDLVLRDRADRSVVPVGRVGDLVVRGVLLTEEHTDGAGLLEDLRDALTAAPLPHGVVPLGLARTTS